MIFREVVIDPHERRRVVIETFVGRERRGEWKTEALNEIQEFAHRIGIGAQPLECERISDKKREQRIRAPCKRECAECEELVLHEGPARAKADLVLRVLLSKSRIRVVHEL